MNEQASMFSFASDLDSKNIPFALVTLVEVHGTAPRSNGRMAVSLDGSYSGTVGGGEAEAFAIDCARRMIAEGTGGLITFAEPCVRMFVDVICPARRLLLVGGGHVSLAIAQAASKVGFEIQVVENRPHFADVSRFPMASRFFVSDTIASALSQVVLDTHTYVVVTSRATGQDELVSLVGSCACYVGLLCSRARAAQLYGVLDAPGQAKLHAPIGLDIGSETPDEIAIAVMAEILKVANSSSGRSLCEVLD